MEWDTPENYERRQERLNARIAMIWLEIPEGEPFSEEQCHQLRDLVAEKSELLHWSVYCDSFSRNNLWLYGDYLSLNSNEARFAVMAFRSDPKLKNSEFGIAFEKYVERVLRRKIHDPYIEAWLKKKE
ncbi:MAG: hypothetical protein ABIJ65_15145 [Chloroflexota bacterium]